MSDLNVVDQLVKRSILNSFSVFPTRIHVLTHCLFGNGTGFEWVEKDDGFLYLEHYRDNDDENLSFIKHLELSEHRKDKIVYQKSVELSNLIRSWINENIDEYCLSKFKPDGFDYRPKKLSNLISRNFNRLCDIDDMSKIAPVWRDAIKEVCSYYMRILAPSGYSYREALDVIVGKENRDSYLIMFNAIEKIKELSDSKSHDDFMIGLLDEIHGGKSLNDLLRDDWEGNLKDKISFDDFLSYREWFINKHRSVALSRSDIVSQIKKMLKSKDTYLNDAGDFNEHFFAEYNQYLNYVGWTYFDERSVVSIIMRYLKISSYYKTKVAAIVEADMNSCYGS